METERKMAHSRSKNKRKAALGDIAEPLRFARPYWQIPAWTIAYSGDEPIWQAPRDMWFGHGQFWWGHVKWSTIEGNLYAHLVTPSGDVWYLGGQYLHRHGDDIALDFHELKALNQMRGLFVPKGSVLIVNRSCANVTDWDTIAWDFEILIQTIPDTAKGRLMVKWLGKS